MKRGKAPKRVNRPRFGPIYNPARSGMDGCIPPRMKTREGILVDTVWYAMEQLSSHNLIMGAEYPPWTLGNVWGRTIALVMGAMGVSPLFINILRFAPKSTPSSHLDRGHLDDLMSDDRRRTQWVEHLADAVRKVYRARAQDKDSGVVVQQNNTPVIYISGKTCFKAWKEKKLGEFDHVRIISEKYGVHVYKVKGSTDDWVIVMEDHPHPSATLKFRGGWDGVRKGTWPLAVGLVKVLVLGSPPKKDSKVLTEEASWVNADHDDIRKSFDALITNLLNRTEVFESRLREWFGKWAFAKSVVSQKLKAKIEDCVSLFSSNITAVADDMMQGFLSRLDSVRELLINDVELFTKLFLSHKSMVVTFAGDRDGTFFLRAKEWYDILLKKDAKLWVTLFSQTSLPDFVAGDHDLYFFSQARNWYTFLEENAEENCSNRVVTQRFVTLFSHHPMVYSVAVSYSGPILTRLTGPSLREQQRSGTSGWAKTWYSLCSSSRRLPWWVQLPATATGPSLREQMSGTSGWAKT